MKQMILALDELKIYAGCDSVGIILTEEDAIFMFVFTELGVLSKVTVPIVEIYNTKFTDDETETMLLEAIHDKINDFKRGKF